MSQVSIIDIAGNYPQIPIQFNANVGFAIPIANMLEILGETVVAGSTPVQTIGSGNTITNQVQISQAIASTNINNVGLAAFDSASFDVDASGFVTFIGGPDLTITGNVGGPQAPVSDNWNLLTANATPKFVGTSGTFTLDFNVDNILLGVPGSSISSAFANTALGQFSMSNISTGQSNVSLGHASLTTISSGSFNVCLGEGAMFACAGNVNSNIAIGWHTLITGSGDGNTIVGFASGGGIQGDLNVAIGYETLQNLGNGSTNIAIGPLSGTNYSGSESGNIVIDNAGVTGESLVTRIGDSQTAAFISGIFNPIVAGSAVVGIDSNEQLSSLGFGTVGQIFTSNGSGNSPTWQAPITSNVASSVVTQGSALNLTSATNIDVTSISLTAGTWIVFGIVAFGNTPTITGAQRASITTVSATHGAIGDNSFQAGWLTNNFAASNCTIAIPGYQITLVSTTTVYLVASAVFVGSMNVYGRINAFRIV